MSDAESRATGKTTGFGGDKWRRLGKDVPEAGQATATTIIAVGEDAPETDREDMRDLGIQTANVYKETLDPTKTTYRPTMIFYTLYPKKMNGGGKADGLTQGEDLAMALGVNVRGINESAYPTGSIFDGRVMPADSPWGFPPGIGLYPESRRRGAVVNLGGSTKAM